MSTNSAGKLPWDDAKLAELFKGASKITGPFADSLLKQAEFPPSASSTEKLTVLDNACGMGIISQKVMEVVYKQRDLSLTCADLADAMVEGMKKTIEAKGWTQANAIKADAQDTKLPSSQFSHIFFNFGPFLLPDPFAGVKECYRMLKPGGTLGFTTWNFVPWSHDMREALAERDEFPKVPGPREMMQAFSQRSEPWDNVEDVKSHCEQLGFVDIKVETVRNVTVIEIEKELAGMLPYTLGMMLPKFWTKEELDKFMKPAEKVMMEYVRQKYNGGPVLWEWIAIIATGKKPE